MVTWQFCLLLAVLLAGFAGTAPTDKAEYAAGLTFVGLAAAIAAIWTAL